LIASPSVRLPRLSAASPTQVARILPNCFVGSGSPLHSPLLLDNITKKSTTARPASSRSAVPDAAGPRLRDPKHIPICTWCAAAAPRHEIPHRALDGFCEGVAGISISESSTPVPFWTAAFRDPINSPPMPDEKESPAASKPVAADPAKDPAIFDAFAEQAVKTAVWSEAVQAQLPKKTE